MLSIFVLSLTSELLDQSASASKSFVTTLLALPKLKSFAAASTEPNAIPLLWSPAATLEPEPIHILLLPLTKSVAAFLPIKVLLAPVLTPSPDWYPIKVFSSPVVTASPASVPIAMFFHHH